MILHLEEFHLQLHRSNLIKSVITFCCKNRITEDVNGKLNSFFSSSINGVLSSSQFDSEYWIHLQYLH